MLLKKNITDISGEVKEFLDEHLEVWLKWFVAPTSPVPDGYDLMSNLWKASGGEQPKKGLRLKKGQKAPLEDTAGVEEMRRVQTKGFTSIPGELYVACLKAGLKSGDEYKSSKNSMHFEIPNTIAFIGSGYP